VTRISKNPEERKEEILDAAMELFLTRGYEKTSVSDIVRRINVAQGLFYYYFKSKEEVFRAVMERLARQFSGRIIAIIRDDSLTFRSRIEKVVDTMHHVLPVSESILMDEIHQEEFRAIHYRLAFQIAGEVIGPIAELLATLRERGLARVKDPKLTASFLVFGVFGLVHGEDDLVHDKKNLTTDTLLDMLSGLLGVSPEVLKNI